MLIHTYTPLSRLYQLKWNIYFTLPDGYTRCRTISVEKLPLEQGASKLHLTCKPLDSDACQLFLASGLIPMSVVFSLWTQIHVSCF